MNILEKRRYMPASNPGPDSEVAIVFFFYSSAARDNVR